MCLAQRDGCVYCERTERLVKHPHEKACHGIYLGMAHFLTDRMFLADYESLTGLEMTQTILFSSFKNRVTRLTGLKLGVSGSGERMPCCARVVYEFLGQTIDVRRALRLCGLHDPDDARVDAATRAVVVNDVTPGEWHFRGRLPFAEEVLHFRFSFLQWCFIFHPAVDVASTNVCACWLKKPGRHLFWRECQGARHGTIQSQYRLQQTRGRVQILPAAKKS